MPAYNTSNLGEEPDKSLPATKRRKIKNNEIPFSHTVSNDGFVVTTSKNKSDSSKKTVYRPMKILQFNGQSNSKDKLKLNKSPILEENEKKILNDLENKEREKEDNITQENESENVISLSEEELHLIHPVLYNLAIHFKKYYNQIRSCLKSSDAEKKSLILTHHHYMKRFSCPPSKSETIVNWFYDRLNVNSGYLTCNKDFLEVEFYRQTLIQFSNPKYLKHAKYKRLFGNTPYTVHKNFEKDLFNLLQNKSNFQDGHFEMMYFAGKDYPGFMRLPLSEKRKMTIDDVKPLTNEMIEKKVDKLRYSLSLIYIFREAIKGFGSDDIERDVISAQNQFDNEIPIFDSNDLSDDDLTTSKLN